MPAMDAKMAIEELSLAERLRASPRALAGLAVVAVLLWVYAVLELNDAVVRGEARVAAAWAEVERREHEAGDQRWLARERESAAAVARAEARLWRGATPGLIQAEFQRWLSDAIARSGLGQVQIRLSAPQQAEAAQARTRIAQMNALVTARFDQMPFFTFLSLLEKDSRDIVLSEVEIRRRGTPKLVMTISAPYRLSGNAGGGS